MTVEILEKWEEKILKIESLTRKVKELQIKLGELKLENEKKVYIEDMAYLSMSGDTVFFKDEAETKILEYLRGLKDGD